jgi:hypothetical protein
VRYIHLCIDVIIKLIFYSKIALMLGRLRMDINTAINHYGDIAKQVFSDLKILGGDGMFKARILEEAIKSVVKDITGDSESPLLEGDEAGVCRT